MSQSRPSILLEFNELTPELMFRFIKQGLLPNFERFYNQSYAYITDPEEKVENLEPWIQWVTVHTGLKAEEHGIQELGEASKLPEKGLTELFSEQQKKVLICGTMNVRFDDGIDGAVIPDPWTTNIEPSADELKPFYNFVQSLVQKHTDPTRKLAPSDYLAFVRFMLQHGLTLTTIKSIISQLTKERITGKFQWRRVSILDRVVWDVFKHYYKKISPDFSTLYLNSVAHLQHHYWRNLDPHLFKVKPSEEEQKEFKDAVLYGYQKMDAILGEVVDFAGKDATLMLCSAVAQKPCLIYEDQGGKVYYRATKMEKFLDFAGITEKYVYSPVMSEEFHLKFDSEKDANSAAEKLSSLMVDGKPLMRGAAEGDSYFGGCGVFSQVDDGVVVTNPLLGYAKPFAEMFYQAENLKSGMHDPKALFWVRQPDCKHLVAEKDLPLTAIAPTILSLAGISPPDSMKAQPIAELSTT